jgi:hypothetical protein
VGGGGGARDQERVVVVGEQPGEGREALVEALYRQELAELCASAGGLLAALPPERALRAWMDRFAGYVR